MRKLISVIIMGVMILTIFGLYCGVVEEVTGGATYDSGTNTIIITGFNNNLDTIGLSIDDSIFWYNSTDDSYSTKANILVDNGAVLEFLGNDILKFHKNGTDELNLTVKGTIDCIGVNPLSMVTFTSNESTPSSGDWEGINFITIEAESSNVNYINLSYPQVGIYFDTSSTNVSNSVINICSDNGIKCNDAVPLLDNLEISNIGNGESNDAGLFVFSSSPVVKNSTFLNNLNKDILLYSDSHPVLLNTSFDSGKIDFDDSLSNLTVKWYLDVYAEDKDTGDPVSNATVVVKDSYGNEVDGNPFSTDSMGHVRWIQAINYVRSNNPPFIEPHTPHNITVSHDEYYTNNTEETIDSSMQVQVNLTMIRRDLTTDEDNITFSPSGIPIAGEDLIVYAKIHNIEVDDAHDVRVIINDDAPEGIQEIHNSTISEIKGNSSKNALDVWKPTPGTHTIDVMIDPFNTINEINSNPIIQAEQNNDASTVIDVNARPLVNITEPDEGIEINRTVFINGTAYDDPADDALIGNDIARVDIRLDNYEWIELILFIDILPNGSPGGWIWDYEWDTKQWNGTPISDGNYTIQARSWDNYHLSYFDEIKITVNNTGANTPPDAVISSPANFSAFNVYEVITFNGLDSNDSETALENLNFTWDFDDSVDSDGDGDFMNDENGFENVTTYAYESKGFFNITLMVTDEGGLNDTAWITIEIWNYPPVVDITASNTTVYENDTVTFNGSGSYDPDGLVSSYLWNFDDGTILLTAWPIVEVNHSFNESRIFNVTLTVTDNNGTSNTTWIFIDVLANAVPQAFIDDPDSFETFSVNETIFFNATGSSDLNDVDLEYFWDFGDGENSGNMTQPTTTHHYSSSVFPFNYIVTLTVRDDEGQEDSTSITLFIENIPPVAIATSDVSTSPTYQDITSDGSDSYDEDGTIASYEWVFDDGNTASGQVVDHQFIQDGEYNVTLTVVDNDDANHTDWIIITITNRDPVIEYANATPDTPGMDEIVTFDVITSDIDGQIVKYEWDFDDGQGYENFTNEKGNTTYSYDSKGEYTARLRITDDDGATNTTSILIKVVNTPPEVVIESPQEDASVAGIVTIRGTASDIDDSVDKVEVRIDSGNWFFATDESSDNSWSTWSYEWDTEDGVPNGEHTIYVRANDSESDTTPPASVLVNVSNTPSSISVTGNLNPSSVEAGGTVEVNGNVTYNTGENVENAIVNVTILGEDGYWLATTDSSGIYSTDITAPSDADSYTVKIRALKGSLTPAQTTEILTVTAPPAKPDLTVATTDISFDPPSPSSGETVQIQIRVWNTGNEDANSVLINVYDGDPDAGGDRIDSSTVTVQKNQNKDVFVTWDTTGISGIHNIFVVLDPSNSIVESNENNNKATSSITVSGKPDFAIDSDDIIMPGGSPKVGEEISISITIHNEGTESGKVTYEVYDGEPSIGIIIKSGSETILSDKDKTVFVVWTPEEGGDHDIYVVLDPDDDVDEDDEDNNEASKPISVEKEPSDGGVPPWLIMGILIVVLVVIVLLFIMNRRGKGSKPEQKLPVAQVVKQEAKTQTAKVEEETEEEDKTLMDGHGGIRI